MDTETDQIKFEYVDITDIKHVQGCSFKRRRSIIFASIADPDIAIVDIEKMMETGMNVGRFMTSHSTKDQKINLIRKFDKAAKFLARKYGLLEWPCATGIELKTSIVETGLLEEEVGQVMIKEDTEVILTSNTEVFDKCNDQRIFVDDPYLESDVGIGMEINISQEEIIMKCIAKISHDSIKCIVTKGGYLKNMAHVCLRGAKRSRPCITKRDLHIVRFAVEYQLDMIIVNYVRSIDTILKIKRYLGSALKRPMIIIGISTQDALNYIDDFIREGDGIIFSREFLAYEVERQLYNRMGLIQSYIAGKCRQACKPFYISGEVLKESLLTGNIHTREISDVTNAILQGASGFSLGSSPNIDYVIDTIKFMNDLCPAVEPLTMDRTEFWHIVSQSKMPVNAAESCAMSCAVVANQTNAPCIVVPTVSGRTVYLLNWLRPNSIVIAVSTKVRTIRRLKAYRSVTPLLYKGASRKTWFHTVQARINYAIQYAVERKWIKLGDYYITLEKGTEKSSFCDAVRIWNVTMTEKNKVQCPESYHDFDINAYARFSKKLDKTVEKEKKKRRKEETRKKSEVLEIDTEQDLEVENEK